MPALDLLVAGPPTAPDGSLVLGATTPAGLPSGVPLHLQFWVQDPGGPKGFSSTNGIVGTTPQSGLRTSVRNVASRYSGRHPA